MNRETARTLRENIREQLESESIDVYLHFDIIKVEIYKEVNDDTNIQCSILTDAMIEYDRQVLFNNEIVNDYIQDKSIRPYFAFLNINYKLIKKIVNYTEDCWYKAKLVKKTENNVNENNSYIKANLIYSLSPIVVKNCELYCNWEKIEEDKLNEINEMYDSGIKNIKCQPSICFKICNDEPIDVIKVYKLGDGNCNYVVGNNKRILYDIGYNIKSIPYCNINRNKYKNYISAVRRIKPSLVVISHWDLDHFIGCAYCNDSLFKVDWITKELDHDVSISAKRLAMFLNQLGRLKVININTNIFNCCTNISLHVGKGNDKNISKRNREGLYLIIKGNDKTAVLTGDVPYRCLSDVKFYPDFIIAPHHGGKMEYGNSSWGVNKNLDKFAVISTNNSNINRPRMDHVEFLNSCGYMVKITENLLNKTGYIYKFSSNSLDEY